MAAATLTPNRFSSSYSGAQGGYGASAPSLADTLPSIDFGFNDLRERMQQFTVRFDDFIERGRKRVLEERNAFRMSVAELEDVQRIRKHHITELESKSTLHADTLHKEAAEADEMSDAIAALTQEREEHLARRDKLEADIAATQAIIKQKREAQNTHRRALEAQARHNVPELQFWERCLGLRIEASGLGQQDQLRFVFVCADEREEEKEAWFEMNLGGREYEVVETRPRLEGEHVDELQERLNESGELGSFFKAMRGLFVQAVRNA